MFKSYHADCDRIEQENDLLTNSTLDLWPTVLKIELRWGIMVLRIIVKFDENWITPSKVIMQNVKTDRKMDRHGDYYRRPESQCWWFSFRFMLTNSKAVWIVNKANLKPQCFFNNHEEICNMNTSKLILLFMCWLVRCEMLYYIYFVAFY